LVHTAVYPEENALPGKRPGKDNDRKTITAGIQLPQENERRNDSRQDFSTGKHLSFISQRGGT
jgi:hypothetical protein